MVGRWKRQGGGGGQGNLSGDYGVIVVADGGGVYCSDAPGVYFVYGLRCPAETSAPRSSTYRHQISAMPAAQGIRLRKLPEVI